MRMVFSVLKVMLLVLLSVSFLFVLIGTLSIGVFDRKVLKADFYKDQLREANFYERVYDDVMPEIKGLPNYYGGISITQQEANQLIRQIIPPQWLQEQVEPTLDSAIPWIRSDTDELNLVIDLRPAKQRAHVAVLQFASQKLDNLPEGPLPDLEQVAGGEFPPYLPGKPASPERQAIVQQAVALLTPYVDANIDKAPDKLDLIQEEVNREGKGKTKAEFLEDRFGTGRDIIDLVINKIGLIKAYLALAVLLVLIALLNWGKLRALLRWVGGTMLFTSLPLLVMGLYAHIAGPGLVKNKLEEGIDDVPANIIKLASDLSGSAIKEISWTFVLPAIVITGIGLVLFVLSFVVQRQEATRGD